MPQTPSNCPLNSRHSILSIQVNEKSGIKPDLEQVSNERKIVWQLWQNRALEAGRNNPGFTVGNILVTFGLADGYAVNFWQLLLGGRLIECTVYPPHLLIS